MTRPSRAIAPRSSCLSSRAFSGSSLPGNSLGWISPDLVYQVLPWYQLQAVSWHHGVFPLWDPHIWGGQPLIGQLQPGSAYPLNWILFLLPLKEGRINPLWLNFSFIGAHFLAALFFYWLCRELKRSRPASILAGAAFALGGLGRLGWLAASSERHHLDSACAALLCALATNPSATPSRMVRDIPWNLLPERPPSDSHLHGTNDGLPLAGSNLETTIAGCAGRLRLVYSSGKRAASPARL